MVLGINLRRIDIIPGPAPLNHFSRTHTLNLKTATFSTALFAFVFAQRVVAEDDSCFQVLHASWQYPGSGTNQTFPTIAFFVFHEYFM